MKLSIIVPIRDNAATLSKSVNDILGARLPCDIEIILVDANSRDGSWRIVKQFATKPNVFSFRQKERSIGTAIRKGIELSSGEFIGWTFPTGEYRAQDFGKLVLPLMHQEAHYTLASRFRHNTPIIHRFGSYYFHQTISFIIGLFSGNRYTDVMADLKFFEGRLLRGLELQSTGRAINAEIIAKLSKLKVHAKEYSIHYDPTRTRCSMGSALQLLWGVIRFGLQPLSKGLLPQLPAKYLPTGQKA